MLGVRWILPFEAQPPSNGACVGYPTDWWFPEKHAKGERRMDYVAAKEICAECHVREECLDYAIAAQEQHGIWGGLSIDQRTKVANERRKNGTLKLFARIPVNEQYL